MTAPSLILAPIGESRFHIALLGLKIQPVLDIDADTKHTAMETVKSILETLPEMDGWAGELKSSGLRILNPTDESQRWLIDFSPSFDEVNADLITPTIARGSAS